MKITTIIYNKVFSLGNYENEKLGIEIELQEGEDAQAAMDKAKQFVEFNHELNSIHDHIQRCEDVLLNADNYTGSQIKQAAAKKEELQHKLDVGLKLLK
jgi:hypothetical protein